MLLTVNDVKTNDFGCRPPTFQFYPFSLVTCASHRSTGKVELTIAMGIVSVPYLHPGQDATPTRSSLSAQTRLQASQGRYYKLTAHGQLQDVLDFRSTRQNTKLR